MSDPITINGRPLSLAWGSNSPLVQNGGYGSQTALIVPRLISRLGIQAGVSAFYGQYAGKLRWDGYDIYPCGFERFGNDIHAANAHQMTADLLLTHQDVWAQQPSQLTANGMRWACWYPIDSEPLAPEIAKRLTPEYCYQPIALSRFGHVQALEAGVNSRLVLQGIDTRLFTPGSKREARERLGWPQDAFYVGMVGHNRGYPNRKAYPQNLEAFGQFFKRHTDARLYIHAYSGPEQDPEAVPLPWHLERYGALGAAEFVKPYDLNMGCSVAHMVDLYRAFDVFLGVSMAEGFMIPLIEAQACGTPVVTGDWTAMSENCYAGWLVAKEDSEPWPMSPLECFWRLPHIGAIAEQLELAYSALQNSETRAALAQTGSSAIVTHHDQDNLIDTQWRPVLEEIARRIEAEQVPYHRHVWSETGTATAQGLIAPCAIVDCPAELRINGTKDVFATGAPVVVDGITLDIEDDPNGGVKHAIASEIVTTYRLQDLTFKDGDVVIDVGAHVGIVSCYLAKKWPRIKIAAFEPIPANHKRLIRNLEVNGCTNVLPFAFRCAVTADGRDLTISGDPHTNTGHYSAFAEEGSHSVLTASRTLASFLHQNGIERIALLKLDCEGAEYEILYGMGGLLKQVDRLVMEVHENNVLEDGARLVAYAKRMIPNVRASIIPIPDSEEVTNAGA
jgi:FkbM family methyltransferase